MSHTQFACVLIWATALFLSSLSELFGFSVASFEGSGLFSCLEVDDAGMGPSSMVVALMVDSCWLLASSYEGG